LISLRRQFGCLADEGGCGFGVFDGLGPPEQRVSLTCKLLWALVPLRAAFPPGRLGWRPLLFRECRQLAQAVCWALTDEI
jgi:hypothetical protein